MFKKFKTLILSTATAFVVAVPLVTAGVASADATSNGLNCGANLSANTSGSCTSNGTNTQSFQTVLTTIIDIFSLIIGIVAVIMIIIAGFNYITSGGSDDKVKTAKNTILYAVIGLIIVAFAQAIVKFVLNNAKSPT